MLTEKRQKDRLKMAYEVTKLAEASGAKVERQDFSGWKPRSIDLLITTARGLSLALDFDGESVQPDVYVLSWHFRGTTDACLSDAFGNLNRYHYRKATDVAHGFDELLSVLAQRLDQALTGEAFDAEREAASIAKHGTDAERKERFRKFFEEQQESKSCKQ